MVFEPGIPRESMLGNRDALRLPVTIVVGRRRPLTTRMWGKLFSEMEDAALTTDMRLYEEINATFAKPDYDGFDYILRHMNRFVVTSVDRGSVVIGSAVFLAVTGWAYKKFIEPGWEKSDSKKVWDDSVANLIDRAVPILKEQIDVRVVHKLKRLNVKRVSIAPPPNPERRVLADNTTKVTELFYDKPAADSQKKESPH